MKGLFGMRAVLHLINLSGENKERVWDYVTDKRFTALIKYFVQDSKEESIQIIEKTSTRPATFQECYRFSQILKKEYGKSLKQIIIWNLDELRRSYPTWFEKSKYYSSKNEKA